MDVMCDYNIEITANDIKEMRDQNQYISFNEHERKLIYFEFRLRLY